MEITKNTRATYEDNLRLIMPVSFLAVEQTSILKKAVDRTCNSALHLKATLKDDNVIISSK